MIKKPELLCPGGTLESIEEGLKYGADSVYIGLPSYSMRSRSKISIEEIYEGITIAHSNNKKVYIAFNIFANDRDFINFDSVAKTINSLNPDALIVADPGVFTFFKNKLPNIPLHVSTQANICSSHSVKFWQNLGASLCVLSRETSHKDFIQIRKNCPDIKLEIFIHGSMCMAYSGRCLISNFISARSPNRGACSQPCRFNYISSSITSDNGNQLILEQDNLGSYILNSKDLCLMPVLDQVLAANPDSLKIEGRNRSEYYVGSVVRAYRLAIDAYFSNPNSFNPEPFQQELNVLESRGYTTAFFNGVLDHNAHNFDSSRSKSSHQVAGVIRNINSHSVIFELRNEIKQGDTLFFILPNRLEKVQVKLDKIINAKNNQVVPKLSAGQANSISIPLERFDKKVLPLLSNLILAYKKIS